MKIELKNITEIAFFRSLGFEVAEVRLSRESKRETVYFTLERDMPEAAIRQHRSDFLNRRGVVEPRQYTELIRETTDLLFETLRRGKRKGSEDE